MISILLATYNGERYIEEQLASLLEQSVQDFAIHIRDDCSNDNTVAIVEQYIRNYPGKITLTVNKRNTGNPKYNFIKLMMEHKDDYLMLCDQDDVWMPDKIEKTLSELSRMERDYGSGTPLLVHTDLRVVDQDLKLIHPSFKRLMNANYERVELKDQLIQNTLTGCTCMYNRALSELIRSPDYMVMHDWWLMLIASSFGRISHIDDQTMLYRQHGANEIGAKNVRSPQYIYYKITNAEEIRTAIRQTYLQAESLLKLYGTQLSPGQKQLVTAYCGIPRKHKLGRWLTICRLGVLKHGITRKIANFIYI